MNNDRNFNIYNILFNDLNVLKEKVNRLEKDYLQLKDNSNSDNSVGIESVPVIVTDTYLSNNTLNIVLYDRKLNKSITKTMNLYKLNNDNGNEESLKKTGSFMTVENVADEINKILDSNSVNE